jgi:Protein of unknown function (DUF1592)/Protein of unknown function (DUF1588)/Protein of unknown function (DUF1595)/Protein of unknown function (DUF1587)/Protein of unknown function (DUF1585)
MTERAAQRWLCVLPLLVAACTSSVGSPGAASGGSAAASGGGGGTTSVDPAAGAPSGPGALSATSRAMRLSNAQWEATIQDLFRLPAPLGLSSSFVADPSLGAFDTYGGQLLVDSNRWQDYQTAAETVAKQVAHDPQLLAGLAPAAADATTRKANFLRDFGLRAFRRPLTDADVARYSAVFDKGAPLIGSGDAFVDGVELTLRAFLQSPNFLYRLETSASVVGGRVPLNDYEIGARLSYGLTGTMPDDGLLGAAAAGKLHGAADVTTEAQRLVGLPSGQTAGLAFHAQLLHFSEYEQIQKDPLKAPAFTAELVPALKQEALAFIQNVVYEQDRGIAELLSAPYTFANSSVAGLYGANVPAPPAGQADAFVRLELDPTQRAGLLTQIGFLAANGIDQTPSIIPRGVHIAEDILCVPLPAPPANVPPLPALDPSSTNRERVATLTMNAPCSGCHTSLINPLGFALETLDGFGQYRTTENGKPIDATGTYSIDGKDVSFNGPVELMKALATSEQVHDCYARHLAEYIYGRDLDANSGADSALITQVGAQAKSVPSTKSLMVALVTADVFLSRAP